MRTLCFVLCLFVSEAAWCVSATDLLNDADDAKTAVGNEKVPTTPSGGPGGGASSDLSGCAGGNPSGRISLLGVQSEMGPSTQGMSPVMKLGPEHPAMKPLRAMQTAMGMSNDPSPAAEAARQRKGMADTYEFFLAALSAQPKVSKYGKTIEQGTMIGDLTGWVYQGQLKEMAKAYNEQRVLAQQYATLYKAAEEAGRACP